MLLIKNLPFSLALRFHSNKAQTNRLNRVVSLELALHLQHRKLLIMTSYVIISAILNVAIFSKSEPRQTGTK